MKKYILDLSEAKLPAWWPETTPQMIRCQEGGYQKEYDVSPEEMRRKWAKDHTRQLLTLFPRPNYCLKWPIGFNRNEMPKGAKLVEQS